MKKELQEKSQEEERSLPCNINPRLLPLKIHYFLRYGGAAPIQLFLPLLVRQRGVSPQGIGLIWTFMPAVGVLCGTFLSTLSDCMKAHRSIFLASLVIFTSGLVGIYWSPHVKPGSPLVSTLIQVQSPTGNTTTPPLETPPEVENLIVEDDAADLGVLPEEFYHPHHDAINASSVINSTVLNATVGSPVSGEEVPLSGLLSLPGFWFIVFCMALVYTGVSTSTTMGDATCYLLLGSDRHRYGQQRLWGTVGLGLFAMVSGALVDLYSVNLPYKDYFPGFILVAVFMSLDIMLVARMNMPTAKGKISAGAVGGALCTPRTFLFLMVVLDLGMSMGILWAFHLMLVEEVSIAWDPNFQALKLLQGLITAIQCFCGEAPFLFIAGYIIKRLGTSRVFALIMTCHAIRYTAYYLIVNPWYFLPFEFFNGVTYALYHATGTLYASEIAPPGAQATLQAVVRVTQFAGTSIAGLMGGLLWSWVGGQVTFLLIGVFNVVFCIIYLICDHLIDPYQPIPDKEAIVDKKGYVPPGEKNAPSAEV